MKRNSLCALICALLASLALTTFAFADFGPKPQLTVRVENAPQEPYYLDLLAEGDWDAEDEDSNDGIDWSYHGKENTLDPALLTSLRDNVPTGWHACVAQGTTGAPIYGELYSESTDASGNDLHVFGYHGVPSTYRIILVTQSGKVWLSDELERRVLQSSVTVHWADRSRKHHRHRPLDRHRLSAAIPCDTRADAPHRGHSASSVPILMEAELESIFACQPFDTGAFGCCLFVRHRAQRRERLVSLFLPASSRARRHARRGLPLLRPRSSHRPQQGPRRTLCCCGKSCLGRPRLLPCRARLAARRVHFVNTLCAAAFSGRRTPLFSSSLT